MKTSEHPRPHLKCPQDAGFPAVEPPPPPLPGTIAPTESISYEQVQAAFLRLKYELLTTSDLRTRSKEITLDRHRLRRARGHSILELAMLSTVFVVFSVFALDVCFVLVGSQLNDRACRDAARAAAQADNRTTAIRMARAAMAVHAADGYFVTPPELDLDSFSYEDFNGAPPTNTSPFVSVTTSTEVRIPAPVFFFGATYGENQTLQFRRTYNFPIVKTQLYL